MSKLKVLVVEDEGIVAEDIRTKLEGQGYTVAAVAVSGEEALRAAEEIRPDVVLMDIQMPGKMDGIDAAERIRDCCGVPVIYLTAYADDETVRRAKVTEPYGYILKPFQTRELHSVIQMAVYKHGMEKQLEETRQRLAAIVRSMGDALIAADTDGRVILMNPVAEALTGWKEKEAVGKNIGEVFRIVDAKTRAAADCPAHRALSSGAVTDLGDHDILLVTREEKEVPIGDSAAPIRDEKGNTTGVVLVFRDVTERRRAQKAVEVSESRLANAQRVARIGNWRWDLTTDTVTWSNEMYPILGVDKASYIPSATAFSELVHPDDLHVMSQESFEQSTKKGDYEIEYRIIHQRTGETRHVCVRGETSFDARGKPVCIVGTLQDITERKRAAEEVKRQLDELKRWHALALDREDRIAELKREVNELSTRLHEPPPYPSQEEEADSPDQG